MILLYSGASHSEAVAASDFHNLRKFIYEVKDHDEDSDSEVEDIRSVLDRNESTLKHLIVDFPFTGEDDSWNLVFESVTIQNLIHASLFSTEISGFVLDRIGHACNLRSLTLHGSFVEPAYASLLFLSSIRLPHLESFGFVMADEDDELYDFVTYFLRKREKLRRLDLGGCRWDIIQVILPHLVNLRVLAICIDEPEQIESLVKTIPKQMVAIRLSVDVDSERPLVHIFPFHAVK
jgi:hypothetical protein